MRPRHAIASSLHFFSVFSFFAAGFLFFALPYLPEVRFLMADFILNHFELCTSISLGFFLIAFLLLMGFYGLNRGKILRIEMGRHFASIDADAIRQTLEPFFKEKFSPHIVLNDVEVIRMKKLEISVITSSLEESEVFANVEKELQKLLKERFGYVSPFYLIVKST